MTASYTLEVVTESVVGEAITFGDDDTNEDDFAHGAETLLKDRKTGPLPKPRRLTWRGGSMAVNLESNLKIRRWIVSEYFTLD
jgi:hypothetical protein